MARTAAPRYGLIVTSPAPARVFSASRTGVLETPRAVARSASTRLRPGGSSPVRIAREMASSTAAVRSGIAPAAPVRTVLPGVAASAPAVRDGALAGRAAAPLMMLGSSSGLVMDAWTATRPAIVSHIRHVLSPARHALITGSFRHRDISETRSYHSAMRARPWSRRQSVRNPTDERGAPGRGTVTHRSPSSDTMLMPCCGRSLSEVNAQDRVTTDPTQVTCHGLAAQSGRRVP